MRVFLALLFVVLLCTCVRAQVGARVDAEYASWCMVDSLPTGEIVRFTRLVNVATLDVVDIDPLGGTTYAVAGTLMTCEAYDLREALRDPLEDLYEDCQCIYTIAQEDHYVSRQGSGLDKTYDVTFQKVVRRRCGEQMTSTVVFRDTLTETGSIDGYRVNYSVDFTATGGYVDQVDVRVYTSGGVAETVSIDLDPGTVQASYPGLTLNSADFSYDGSNLAAISAAYEVVIVHAITQAQGAPVNEVEVVASGGNVSIRFYVQHQPGIPYAVLPQQGDPDYSFSGSNASVSLIGVSSASLTTRTGDYDVACDTINSTAFARYVRYNPDDPLNVRVELTPDIRGVDSESDLEGACVVSPAVCSELAADPVEISGCVEVCSDVLNIAGHFPAADLDTTLTVNTYNSVSILVTQGPVGVTIDGQRIDYPAGWSSVWSAEPGHLLANSFIISATGGEAIISFIR